MKVYINGISNCVFWVTPVNGIRKKIEISNNYNFGGEYDEEYWLEETALNGKHLQVFLYLHKEWELDFSQLFLLEDANKIKEILNIEKQGGKIEFAPDSVYNSRSYEVHTVKEKRKVNNHYGNQGSKDFILLIRTVNPLYATDWLDPNEADKGILPTGSGIDNII